MSLTIDNAFVTKFQDRFHVVAQQRKSRLEQFAKKRLTAVVGESFTIDLLGQSNATPNRPRHSDLQYANLDNTRRIALMQDLEPAELIDAMDKMKMLIDPTNQYTEALLADCNRFKDKTIINAALGNVITQTANNTTGSSALPASQTIAAAATGLTVAKLRAAKILLDEASVLVSDFKDIIGEIDTLSGMNESIFAQMMMSCIRDMPEEEYKRIKHSSTVTDYYVKGKYPKATAIFAQ